MLTTYQVIRRAMRAFKLAFYGKKELRDIREIVLVGGTGHNGEWSSADVKISYVIDGDYSESVKYLFIVRVYIDANGIPVIARR